MHAVSSILLSLSLVFVFACDDNGDGNGFQERTVVDIVAESGEFTILVNALEETGLDQTLATPGPFTLFAPTDEAFERLPPGVLESLDAATLEMILSYHAVPDFFEAQDVASMGAAATVEGSLIEADVFDGTLVLNGTTQVSESDVRADNGVVHVIDSVMLPPDFPFPGDMVDAALAYPNLDILSDALFEASLATTLRQTDQSFTLFAPTNQAFNQFGDLRIFSDAELSGILLYHVADGTLDAAMLSNMSSVLTRQGSEIVISPSAQGILLNGGVNVIRADLTTENGVIHVVDTVLQTEPL